jgi:hypothetical protein
LQPRANAPGVLAPAGAGSGQATTTAIETFSSASTVSRASSNRSDGASPMMSTGTGIHWSGY